MNATSAAVDDARAKLERDVAVLTDRLVRETADAVPRSHVEDAVRVAHARYESAKLLDYVILFIERESRESLREAGWLAPQASRET